MVCGEDFLSHLVPLLVCTRARTSTGSHTARETEDTHPQGGRLRHRREAFRHGERVTHADPKSSVSTSSPAPGVPRVIVCSDNGVLLILTVNIFNTLHANHDTALITCYIESIGLHKQQCPRQKEVRLRNRNVSPSVRVLDCSFFLSCVT